MDNILKLLLGVLSVAGLIAMVTPTNLAPEPANAPVAGEVVVGPPPTEDQMLNEGGPDSEGPLEEDGDDFAIGEPTIDGNPIGASVDQQQQQQQQQQVQMENDSPVGIAPSGGNFSYAAPIAQSSPQVVYAPQPAPGTFVPINNN